MNSKVESSGPGLKKLVPVKRRRVRIAATDKTSVKSEPLLQGQRLPLLVQPAIDGLDLVTWATGHRDFIESNLTDHGALLFRDFGITNLARFQAFVRSVSGELLEYVYRSTPRKEVSGNVYTATEYPAHQEIPQHNEEAYARSWPMKLFFFCELAADQGGMTPIADSYEVYKKVRPELREEFAEKGVMYVRNYGHGIDLPWQEVFQTERRDEVETFCNQAGIEFEWLEGERLRTRQTCQAVARHPKTGKMIWFNQAHLFHISNLEPAVRSALLEMCEEEDLPRNTYYGDGSAIAESDLEEIRRIYHDQRVIFPWQEGDILLLDNMATSHGRLPFEGERKVRVAMTEPMHAEDLVL